MLQEDRQFDGTLPHQIACAQQYIEELLPQVNRLGHEGLFEGDSPIPRDAWLEALVNAVIHRSYSFFGIITVTLTLSAYRRIANNVTKSLPPRSNEVLETLRRAGKPLGTGEVALAAGISVPVARRALKSLRKEKLVIWEGNSPRDPRATWSPTDPF